MLNRLITTRSDEIFDWAGRHVRRFITTEYPERDEVRILDVGAGQGKYRALLGDYPNVDGVEVWPPYVEQYDLHSVYSTLYLADIRKLAHTLTNEPTWYDVVIMGDVLEHLPVSDAQQVLAHVREGIADDVIVVVPYTYHQDEEHGNPYQRHIQDDLTVELMHERYPDLRLVTMQLDAADRPFKGLYRWR